MSMKKGIYIVFCIMAFGFRGWGQDFCDNARYGGSTYFDESSIRVEIDGQYGIAVDRYGDTVALKYDIYYPDLLLDAAAQRPFVLLIHGGSFYKNDKLDEDSLALLLAESGYVAASINYRMGWEGDDVFSNVDCNTMPNNLLKAMYRAAQDADVAMRFFHNNAQRYHIDPANMFVAGQSAGAVTALNLAFLQQPEIDSLYPQISDSLGDLQPSQPTYTIKGVASMWGALLDTAFIGNEAIPVVMFQATGDPVVAYGQGPFLGYASCYPTMMGSRLMADRLRNRSVCYELDSADVATHGLYYKTYRAQHMACFFKKLMCGTCTSLETQDAPAACIDQLQLFRLIVGKDWVSLYPNPIQGQLNIKMYQPTRYRVLVMDLLGRTLLDRQLAGTDQTLDLGSLSRGAYCVRVEQDGQSVVKTVLVE